MGEQKAFLLYKRYWKQIQKLSNEQAGMLMKAIFAYSTDGTTEEIEDLAVAILFDMMKEDLDANAERYEEISDKRSESGKKGAEKRWAGKEKEDGKTISDDSKNGKCHDSHIAKDSKNGKAIQPMAKMADYDNDYDNDLLKEKDNTSYYPKRKDEKNASSSKIGQEFDELWKAYPRKEGKEGARKAYARYRKNDDSLFEKVKDGIERYREFIKQNNTDAQFVQMGSTWFNGKGWESEYASMKSTAKIIPAPQRYASEDRDLDFLIR